MAGSSGLISVYDPDPLFVLKGYKVWQGRRYVRCFQPADNSKAALNVEHAVYQRLGSHPGILKYGGRVAVADNVYFLKLERAEGDLRSLMPRYSIPPDQARLRMAIQIASSISYLHSKGIFHCDLSCRNVFLFHDWVVKVGDFGGSKIDSQYPLAAEEVRYELPLRGRDWEKRSYVKRELFALECAIYEIMAWERPFPELTDAEVEANYKRETFPIVDGLPAGDIIHSCWKEEFERAEDVEAALRREIGRESGLGAWNASAHLKGLFDWIFR